MLTLNNNTENYNATRFQIGDVKYIIVPVVMIREGVHSGSFGAVLHVKENLQQSVDSWEQTPVTISHPQVNGEYVSAKSDGVKHVGVVTNTRMIDDKLCADIVLNEETLKAVSPNAYNAIINKSAIDVSVGVYSDIEPTQGEWNGETYIAKTITYTPDHLAILPNEKGACSWDDGCGIRVNKEIIINKGESEMKEKVEQLIANSNGLFTNCDKEWLLTQSEQELDAIINDPAQWSRTKNLNTLKGNLSLNEAMELMPEADKMIVMNAIEAEKQRKQAIIDHIIANTENVWDNETLQNMSESMIEKISKTITVKTPEPTPTPTAYVAPKAPVANSTIEPL